MLALLLTGGVPLAAQRPAADSAPGSIADSAAPAAPLTGAAVRIPAPARPEPARPPGSPAHPYIFLRPDVDYGSASLRSPLDVFVNRGFSVLLAEEQERRLPHLAWSNGWAAVRDAMAHPRRAVQRSGGLKQFLKIEIVPSGGRVWEWAWAPNYGGHLLAGGISYRFMAEWFDSRNLPAPRLLAGAVYVASMLTTESLEIPQGPPGISATLADLWIFDPAGMVVFSFDGPARFFAETLQAADWSPQASLVFPGAQLANSSQVMSYKIPLPRVARARVLLLLGQSAASGVRVQLDDRYYLGVAGGFATTGHAVDAITGRESIGANWNAGLYLDRENSLLASAIVSPARHASLQLNLYPGLLPGALRPAGVWLLRSPPGHWSGGLAFRRTLGLGLGLEAR